MSESRKFRYIQVTDNCPDNWDKIIKVAQSCYSKYWYIFHDRDLDDNGQVKKKHLHLVCYDDSPNFITKGIKNFEGATLPNLVEGCRNGRACIRYLVHKDDPQKQQYDITEVVTNSPQQLTSALADSDTIVGLYQSYEELRTGKISVGDFIQRYKQELSSMNFYQQISTFNLLHKTIFKE